MVQLPTPTHDRAQANRDMAEHGYALVADALSPRQVTAMRERLVEQTMAEGPLRGEERSMDDEHLRFDTVGLLNKGAIFLEVVDPESLVFQLVGDTLEASCEPTSAKRWNLEQRFLLGSLDGTLKRLEVVDQSQTGEQAHLNPIYHTDQAMVPTWIPFPVVVNCFYCLTDFTEANGSTSIVPGTHRIEALPDRSTTVEGAVAMDVPAGTAIVVEGRTWHASGINTNGELRASLMAYCCAPWVRQLWPMAMNLRQDVVDRMTRGQLLMCGFDTMYQSVYGSFSGPGILEPTLGRTNVTVAQPEIGELHLSANLS